MTRSGTGRPVGMAGRILSHVPSVEPRAWAGVGGRRERPAGALHTRE